jgi:HSP20 family protein
MLLTTFDPFTFGRTVRAGLPMDSVRRADDVVFRFDLPGVSQDDIEVSVDRGVLSISAKRDEETRSESDRVLVRERVTGTLRRRIYLGDGYDADKVEAAFENGVLTVRVPVAEQAKARKVEISTDASKMIAA